MQMTRRGWLLAAAGASLAAPRKVLVAGHPYVYTQHREDRDINPILDQIFADMRWAGLDAIELMDKALKPDGAVERVCELSKRHRLPVLGMSYTGNLWDRDWPAATLPDLTLLIERLGKVGGRTLGLSVGNAGKPKTDAQLDAQADALRRIMAISKDHGVVVNLHNHTYEVADGEYDLKGTLARVPEVRLGPDLNWLLRAGVDPVDFIRRHGKRIVYMHLRDQKADGKWPEAMSEGSMDYAAIGGATREAGFHGDVAIELAHERGSEMTRPLRESLKISREFVHRTMGF
jgi:sugar phosphate isomerase/epimerase